MANLKLIRELCIEKRIQLRELAVQIGVSQNGLQRIISDNSTKIETLEKIATALNVPVTYFFGGVPDSYVGLYDKDIEQIRVYCEQISCGFDKEQFEKLIDYIKYYFEMSIQKDILTKRLVHDYLKTIELNELKEYQKSMIKLLNNSNKYFELKESEIEHRKIKKNK